MERKEVYKVIDSEQEYVNKFKGSQHSHIVENFELAHALSAIKYNLNKAGDSWYVGKEPYHGRGDGEAMEYIRKIANICVQMGEKYGMPERNRSFEHLEGPTTGNDK